VLRILAGSWATAAPAGPAAVDQTVIQLQAEGYQVIVNKVGKTQSQCATSAVQHPARTTFRNDSGARRRRLQMHFHTRINKTVYVEVGV